MISNIVLLKCKRLGRIDSWRSVAPGLNKNSDGRPAGHQSEFFQTENFRPAAIV